MGNSISRKSFIPKRALYCFNEDAEFDLDLYSMYRRQKRRVMNKIDEIVDMCIEECTKELIAEGKRTRFRSCQKKPLRYRDEDGNLRDFKPTISSWYIMYV